MRSEVGVSERRACGLMQIHRATCRYHGEAAGRCRVCGCGCASWRRTTTVRLSSAEDDAGARRVAVNHKRVYRLYVEEKLSCVGSADGGGRRRRRTRGVGAAYRCARTRSGRWTSRRTRSPAGGEFRTLNLMDGFTREALEIEVDTSLPGLRVVRVLEGLKRRGRKPEAIVIDNGTEFTSQVVDQWAYQNQVQLHFITPGRPMENGFIESFNGKFRDECLNENWFLDLADARAQDRDLAVGLQPGAAALGARLSHPGGVRKIVGGNRLWKRRGRGPLGKRFAFPTFPQPRRRREGSYTAVLENSNPEKVSLSVD